MPNNCDIVSVLTEMIKQEFQNSKENCYIECNIEFRFGARNGMWMSHTCSSTAFIYSVMQSEESMVDISSGFLCCCCCCCCLFLLIVMCCYFNGIAFFAVSCKFFCIQMCFHFVFPYITSY